VKCANELVPFVVPTPCILIGVSFCCFESTGKKICVVLDEVGNVFKHGPVDGPEGFDWETIEDAQKPKERQGSIRRMVRYCLEKRCGGLVHKGTGQLRCGFVEKPVLQISIL